jgi:hypothetical protein
MSPAEIIASLALGAVFVACLFRARLLALAIVPPLGMVIVQGFDLVDTSSASHPLRWIVPATCAGLSGFAAWWYVGKINTLPPWIARKVQAAFHGAYKRARAKRFGYGRHRALIASILVLASNGPDLLALHPFFWARFQTWPLNPLTIALCTTICAVLVAPERWVKWATT